MYFFRFCLLEIEQERHIFQVMDELRQTSMVDETKDILSSIEVNEELTGFSLR